MVQAAHFPPNYIFKSFVYLTLYDMAVSKSGLGSKSSSDIPYKNIQKGPKIPSKGLLSDILYGITLCKSPCDQHHIATMACPPLAVISKL
jgi:hypothetical protein